MNNRLALYLVIVIMVTTLAPSSTRAMAGAQSLRARFDKDGDKKLNAAERKAAMSAVGRSPFGRRSVRTGPGARVSPASVANVPANVPFYNMGTLRTLFFQFEDDNWESQLMAFKETDIEIPATLIVDGKTYKDVGVQFRGNSSFSMVPEGLKHSFNVSIDAFVKDQSLLGFNSLNLLNAHSDPSFLQSVLFLQAARDFIPAARANWVRVVINGENWGIYPNVEQVNKTFLREWYKTDVGTRWKAPGSPHGRAGLEYWGDDPAAYKRTYEIKTKDDPKAWDALIALTRVLNTTPPDKLEAALSRILDIDGVLRFLALDVTLSNNDGYWIRGSDYNIYLDPGGKFHIIPNDINETYGGTAPGFPMNGGPTGPDPLVGLNDATKPLRSKLLAVPALRAKYLAYTREIASKWLDWKTLEPLATRYQALIAADVKADVRKLDSFGAFEGGLAELKTYADRRRQLILSYPQK
jgi:hypothetical protein